MKPKILLLPDVPNWAFDEISKAIVNWLSPKYAFTKLFMLDRPDISPDDFDLILAFGAPIMYDKKFREHSHKVIKGVYSLKWRLQKKWKLFNYTPELFYKESLQCCTAIAAGSKEILNTFYPYIKSYYATNGIDTKFFVPKDENKDFGFTAGWSGNPDSSGDKGFYDYVVPACKKAGVPLKVMKNLTREQMVDFYNSVHIMLCASAKTEAGPAMNIESGACGTSIITTNIGRVPELITHMKNGIIVEREIDKFVEALLFLKGNRGFCLELGRNLRKVVESEWDWEVRSKLFDDMFSDVLNRNTNR
jgi:glycosyltransferase involved in cell wall biosynthesis